MCTVDIYFFFIYTYIFLYIYIHTYTQVETSCQPLLLRFSSGAGERSGGRHNKARPQKFGKSMATKMRQKLSWSTKLPTAKGRWVFKAASTTASVACIQEHLDSRKEALLSMDQVLQYNYEGSSCMFRPHWRMLLLFKKGSHCNYVNVLVEPAQTKTAYCFKEETFRGGR